MSMLFDWIHVRIRNLARAAGYEVPDPASSEAVNAAETRLGRTLPAAYRRMFESQNGWANAWQGLSLFPVERLAGDDSEFDPGEGLICIGAAGDGRMLCLEPPDQPDVEANCEEETEWPLVVVTKGQERLEVFPSFHKWLETLFMDEVLRSSQLNLNGRHPNSHG